MIAIISLGAIMCFILFLFSFFITEQQEAKKSREIFKIMITGMIAYTLFDIVYTFITDKDLKIILFKLATLAAFFASALLGFYFRKKSQKAN